MRSPDQRRRRRMAVATLLATLPLFASMAAPSADAASSIQTLIAQAEHNTNSVRTLVHTDQNTITTPNLTIQVKARGSEDEVHNREQDYESVTLRGRATGGTVKTVHYTADIIFMNGLTYYRTSLSSNQWKTRKGMTFPDPYAGDWTRGRTTVSFPKSFRFQEVGSRAGQIHMRAPFSTATTAGTVDLWISTGSTPYVVREDTTYHATKGGSGTEVRQVVFGPFNSSVIILAPTAQGSA